MQFALIDLYKIIWISMLAYKVLYVHMCFGMHNLHVLVCQFLIVLYESLG
jgi:hypothetical protein